MSCGGSYCDSSHAATVTNRRTGRGRVVMVVMVEREKIPITMITGDAPYEGNYWALL